MRTRDRRRRVGVALLALAVGACTSPASGTAPPGKPVASAETTPAASGPAADARPVAGVSVRPVADPETISFAISDPTITFGPLYVGMAKGYFAEEGLEPQVQVLRPDAIIAALATNQGIDYAATVGSVARGAARGLPVKIVGLWFERIVFFLMARPEIRVVPDLRGKVLGVTSFGGTIDVSLRQALRDGGVDPENDVTIIQLGAGTGRIAAIAQGAAVASLFNPPDDLLAEEQGLHRVPSSAESIPLPFTGVTVSDRTLQERPGQVERVLRATIKTLRFMREQQDEASDLIADGVGADRALNRRAYASVVHTVSPDGWASPEATEGQLREAVEPGAPPPPAAQVFATGPLKAAQASLGLAGRP